MASNSSNIKQTLDLLKCALCKVDLVSNYYPKSLPCLHTFCAACLTNKPEQFIQDASIIVCPVCHTSVHQPSATSEMTSELTKDLKLDVIIEKLLRVRHLQESVRHCEMCSDEGVVVSTHWCQDCGEFLCDSCLCHHKVYKPNDKVIDVSQGMDGENISDFMLPTKCSEHEKKFRMYCAQCEICLCSACLFEHNDKMKNKNCELISIEKVAVETCEKGRQLLQKTCSHLQEENEHIEGLELKIGDLKRIVSEEAKDVWEHVEETVKRLKENARLFIAELEAKTKIEIDELEELIQLKQDHIKEMEIVDNNFQQLLKSFDNVDILLNYSRLKSKCETLMKPSKNDSTSHVVNVVYNFWYLKTHEMSKTVPLGRCWNGLEFTVSSSFGIDKTLESLNTKRITNTPLPMLLPPVPYLDYPNSEECVVDEQYETFSCIFVADEDHVLVGRGVHGTLCEYNKTNTLCGIYTQEQMKYFFDLCRFSSDKICVVDGNLVLWQMNLNKNGPFLTFFKCIEEPEIKYCSICNCFGDILVCDYNCRVYLLSEEGTILKTVLDIERWPSPYHKIRPGPFRDTFLLLDSAAGGLFCYGLDTGQCLFSLSVGYVWDMCTDKYGNIYIAEKDEIYLLSPDTSEKHPIFAITPTTTTTTPSNMHPYQIFIKDDIFYFTSKNPTGWKLEKFNLRYQERSR